MCEKLRGPASLNDDGMLVAEDCHGAGPTLELNDYVSLEQL